MNTSRIASLVRASVGLFFLCILVLVLLMSATLPRSPAEAAGQSVAFQAVPQSHTQLTSSGTKQYFVDVNDGSDGNPGTVDRPLRTISQAVSAVTPGDVVVLREGTYHETISVTKSGTADAPITFQPYQKEHITISPIVSVAGWTGPDSRGIYVAQVPETIELKDENIAVFVNGKIIHQAREPEIADNSDPYSQQWLETPMIKGTAVNIQAANGQYLKAEDRGGGSVSADADIAGPWEEFYLIDTNGGGLVSGDRVGFLTRDHRHYLSAENGGRPGGVGDIIVANRTGFDDWEKFTINSITSKKEIDSGDTITFRAKKDGYLSADQCGGGQVYANSASIGNCEKFTITIYPDSLVLFDEGAVDFDNSANAWAGSYIWGPFGAHWSLNMAKITASAPGKLTIGDRDQWWDSWGWSHGNAAIIGGLSALDTANEWHYETDSGGTGGKLYFKPPGGQNPENLAVEIRQRMWAVDVTGSHVVFNNMDIFGGQVRLKGDNNVLDNVRVSYGTHFVFRNTIGQDSGFNEGTNGVYIEGNDNIVRNSEINYSAGNGLSIVGDRNEVNNCLIQSFGYMGTYTSGVYFVGSGSQLKHSTLFNSGRDILHLGECTGCEITHNLLHDSTLLTDDSGVIYSFGHDLKGTEIAYNWLQGVTNPAREVSSLHLGIYLDNGSRNARVHHNLISGLANKAGVGPNTPHEGHLICNNTIIHDRAVDSNGGSTGFDRIGEKAYCSCDFDRSTSLGNFYFESLGECIHERDTNLQLTGKSWCANPDYLYWMEPARLQVFSTLYYETFNQASGELVNPLEVVTLGNGWQISGDPDFRPKDGSFPVDKGAVGTACDAVLDEVTGQYPDMGAYENRGTNWIPGYSPIIHHGPLGDPEAVVNAGEYHTCGLRTDKSADCWGAEVGANDHGQADDQAGPFVQIGSGAIHSCGLRPDGSVDCWGTTEWYGQGEDQPGPYSQISVGGSHNCGLKPDGSVECWGYNGEGQAEDQAGPFVQISAGWDHTCGLTPAGRIECWGSNAWGQAEGKIGPFEQVSVGWSGYTCGLTTQGHIRCWGRNEHGQAESNDSTFLQLSTGGRHTCGLKPDGSVDCWGFNSEGQAEDKAGPFVRVSAGGTWMSGGWGHTCGLRSDGSVDCWGSNADGQSANQAGPFGPTEPPAPTPTPAPGPTDHVVLLPVISSGPEASR